MAALSKYERKRLAYGSYVLADAEIVFLDTPKAACTSFKHVVASLGGVDWREMASSREAAKTDFMVIHDRALMRIPSLLDLSEAARTQVLCSERFLRFCVVRNPYVRIASAWVDRILFHSLSPAARILQHIELPEYKPDWHYLRARFAEFVRHLYRDEAPRFSNHHWEEMCKLTAPDVMNYNLVVRTENMNRDIEVIVRHLEKRGLTWPGLPRINETPFKIGAELYTQMTAKMVREMYERDFRTYNYSEDILFSTLSPAALPDPVSVASIQKRNRRISFLSLAAKSRLENDSKV